MDRRISRIRGMVLEAVLRFLCYKKPRIGCKKVYFRSDILFRLKLSAACRESGPVLAIDFANI